MSALSIISLIAADLAHAQSASKIELVPQVSHTDYIYSVDISPDGTLLASAGGDNVIILWDAATGAIIRRFEGHENKVKTLRFLPNSDELITAADDGTMRIWSVSTGEQRASFSAPVPIAGRLLGDSKDRAPVFYTLETLTKDRVLAGYSTGARIWDLRSEARSKAFGHLLFPVYDIAVSRSADVFVTAQGTKDTYVWSIEDGKKQPTLEGHDSPVRAVALSTNGKYVASGAKNGRVLLWELGKAKQPRPMCFHNAEVISVAFSPDGSKLATGGEDGSLFLCDVARGSLIRSLKTSGGSVRSLVFHPDGKHLSAASGAHLMTWNLGPPDQSSLLSPSEAAFVDRELQYPSQINLSTVAWPYEMTVSRDRRLACTSYGQWLMAWEVDSGRTVTRIPVEQGAFTAIAFDHAGKYLAAGTSKGKLAVYSVTNGQLLASTQFYANGIRAVHWAADRISVAASSEDNLLSRWVPGKSTRQKDNKLPGDIWAMAMSADEKLFAVGTGYEVFFYDLTGREDKRRTDSKCVIRSVAFDPQGHYAATGGEWGELLLWRRPGLKPTRLKGHKDTIFSLDFSPDGRYLVSASKDRSLRLWNVEKETTERVLAGHTDTVRGAFFSSDGRSIWSSSSDGSLRLWNVATGREVGRLFRFSDGSEIAVDADGRFDAANLEQTTSLGWVVSDAPLKLLPIELFMRDYYEPRLLSRILAGERLPQIRDLQDLNRIQPHIEIISLTPVPDRPHLVAVRVRVESRKERQGPRGILESQVHDVRLFRDGRLVGHQDGRIALGPDGTQELVFPEVRVPMDGRGDVEFSAYAFNSDRVKSATADKTLPRRRSLRRGMNKAYIVSVGVTATSNPYWSLNFAGEDARLIRESLSKALVGYNVISVTMEGSPQTQGSPFAADIPGLQRVFPTKANIQTVLEVLAGRTVDAARLSRLPANVREQLGPATPDDVVVLAFSCHGVAQRGEFYLLPYDIASGAQGHITEPLLKSAISSEDLSTWIRDIDAGKMIMIVDACYAQAGVERAGFKPAPLGNRGLGQLSYDKGIAILVAAQTDKEAWEAEGASLLTRALVTEGLLEARAAAQGAMTVTDLLKYAAARVPQLSALHTKDPQLVQRPSLFDFKKSRLEVRLYPPK